MTKTRVSPDTPSFFHVKDVIHPIKREKNEFEYITKKPRKKGPIDPSKVSVEAPTYFHLSHSKSDGALIAPRCDRLVFQNMTLMGDPVSLLKEDIVKRKIPFAPYWTAEDSA